MPRVRNPKTEEDMIARYGPELWEKATVVKNTDRENPSPFWNTESLCLLYLSFSKTPKLADASRASGAKPHLINEWRRNNPSFDDFVNSAREEGIGIIEDALFKAAERGNVNAQLAVLRAYKPELYGTSSRVTVTGARDAPYDLSRLSSDEIATLERISNKALISGESVPNASNPLVQQALAARSMESHNDES